MLSMNEVASPFDLSPLIEISLENWRAIMTSVV
jgi:hypothetical protein